MDKDNRYFSLPAERFKIWSFMANCRGARTPRTAPKKAFHHNRRPEKKAFKDNQYRKIDRAYPSHIDGLALPPIASLPTDYTGVKISSYCWRYLDRHFAIEDNRFNDRMGQALWSVQGNSQIYLSTMSTKILG